MKTLPQLFFRIALQCVPKNRMGDKFIALMRFLWVHGRIPTRKLLFNDVLYRIITTDEITDPLRVFVSDKEYLKMFVKATVGDQYNVPTLKVLHTIEEASHYQYPSDCCIKPTHQSGTVILRRQNKAIDLEEIARWFNSTYYHDTREANYKTLKPKVIVEPLVFDNDNVNDYKIFCYDGKPRLIQVDIDRRIDHTRKIFDTDWNEMPFSLLYPLARRSLDKPRNLDKMLAVAGALATYFNFMRVDLYSNGKDCLVGELTNCPENVAGIFVPRSAEILASRMIFGEN